MSLLFSEKTGRNNRNLSKLISTGGTIVLPGKKSRTVISSTMEASQKKEQHIH